MCFSHGFGTVPATSNVRHGNDRHNVHRGTVWRSHTTILLFLLTGLESLKAHPWFGSINWDALLEHRFPPPPGIRERIYNFEGVAYAHFEPKPYEGDTRWMENF